MAQYDDTKFVNIFEEDFTFYHGKEPYEVKAGQSRSFPKFLAAHGAKHLVDLVLQKKHGVSDSLRDTPLRRSVLAQILPDYAEEVEVKPLSPEEFQKQLEEQREKDRATIQSLVGKVEKQESELSRISELEKKIEELKAVIDQGENQAEGQEAERPKGRPRKIW